MIESAPVLAFVRDNLEQILLGVVGLIVPVVLQVALVGLRRLTRRRGGRS